MWSAFDQKFEGQSRKSTMQKTKKKKASRGVYVCGGQMNKPYDKFILPPQLQSS